MWFVAFLVLIEVAVLVAIDDVPLLAFIVAATALTFVVAAVVIFSTLTVAVTTDTVELAFGWGWPKKRIVRTDIVSYEPVRNSWLLGWGIRWFPGGSMWNVWGLDAVQLELASGKKFRIGTDDPQGLNEALSRR